MAKTWLSGVTAAVLVLGSLALFVARQQVLGTETAGSPGWQVTLTVDGTLASRDASLSAVRPPDFRHQHISDEHFQSSKDLRDPLRTRKTSSGQRNFTWRRQSGMGGGPQPFHLEYSFLCSLQRQTTGMERQSARLDAPPAAGAFLKPKPRIQSTDARIARLAASLVPDDLAPLEKVRILFAHVAGLETRAGPATQTALASLGGGNDAGKSRLLVALCRNRGLPARLIGGLILAEGGKQKLHRWAEAWVNNKWLPMCPSYGHFGEATFPENYLVLRVGDGPAVSARGARFQYNYAIHGSHGEAAAGTGETPSAAKTFWRELSLFNLRPAEQHVVKFLLLLPLAALIVSFVRTVIGIPTFGTFSPALIGLMFVDLKSLSWGLPIFVLTVLVGWLIRRLLDRFNLLQVPRVGAMLTLIVLFLIVMIVVASRLGVATTQYVALFPLVILTHLVERFWTIESEDGTVASFRTLLGTLAVAVAISLALAPEAVGRWMFRYPETLGPVLAAQILLGRYTGYRLTELYRFKDLLCDETACGDDDDVVAALASARARAILGMNRRNARCILDLNPRARFPLVDRKSRMRALCRAIGVPTPDIYAVLAAHSALRHLPRLLAERSDFVFKPNRGAGGRGILVIVGRDGDAFVRHNGEILTVGAIQQHVSSIISGMFSLGGRPDEALLQERVIPDAVFARVSYQGTPDLRIVLYRHVPTMAMIRLPTRQSGGRANLHQGAIGAGIDLETGITTHAVLNNRTARCHPDTGACVTGLRVPYWREILDISRRVSEAVGLGYLGVDLVLDRCKGPLLLEANARPGLAIQIANGQGLLPRFADVDRDLTMSAEA